MRTSPLAVLLVLVAMVSAALTAALPASANTFGFYAWHPTWCCPKTDNRDVYWNGSTLTSAMITGADYGMANLDYQTDLRIGGYDSPAGTHTDIVMFDAYYTDYWGKDWDGSSTGVNITASTKCVRVLAQVGGEYLCDRAEIRFDLADMTTVAKRQHTACHEVGHAIGLGHTGLTSCMKQASSTKVYSSHDRGHVNGAW
ncbi:hypothetical protein EDD29_3218 [Actinocorallia herbida]|uniref:Matrixin n=1 Tax=Actinocorallia herbida TaxID=58109 RepID=A0A3N1CWL0_9ACTN|nr:hypothetical protein [Actinocorallia herbida]ROO85671.1 hypothetical protein EDD29_3218 [Actinocorallia herbida]